MNRWLKFAFSHAGFGNPRDVDVAESARGVLAHGARTVLKQARATDGGWGLAALWVTVALVSSLWLQHFFPYPFLFLFLGAVIASAWMGGPLAGALSVVLSTLCVEYFFVPPYYSFTVSATAQSYLVAFAVCASVACWLSATKRASEAVMRQARRDLEVRVAERTAEINASNRELRERERELHVLTEVIPQQIWSGTPDGAIDYCNQRLLDYVGLSMDEMRRAGFLATLHPEDRDGFRQRWQAALSSGQPFEGEWRVRGAEGRYRVFFSRSVPLRRVDGRVIRWYGTNTDIEEHKKAERDLMRTQANLAHLSRAFTMSALTTSIAHEINQPLTAVVAHGYACLGWLDATPPDLARARQTTERIIA